MSKSIETLTKYKHNASYGGNKIQESKPQVNMDKHIIINGD